MRYAEAAAIKHLTRSEVADLLASVRELETSADAESGLGAPIKPGLLLEAMALARSAPKVIEEDGEITGLFPCQTGLFRPKYFRWITVYTEDYQIETGDEPATRWDDWNDDPLPVSWDD